MKLARDNFDREHKFPFLTRLDFSMHWMLSLSLVVCALAILLTLVLGSRQMAVGAHQIAQKVTRHFERPQRNARSTIKPSANRKSRP